MSDLSATVVTLGFPPSRRLLALPSQLCRLGRTGPCELGEANTVVIPEPGNRPEAGHTAVEASSSVTPSEARDDSGGATAPPPPARRLPEPDPAVLNAVAQCVKQGQCILFLGAAVHSPPPEGSPHAYATSERPPLGGAFSEYLANLSGFATHFPGEPIWGLPRVALHYEVQRSRGDLIDEIRRAVHEGKQPSPMLRALARLDFPLVITTNYDRLFERALQLEGKDPIVSVYKRNESGQPQTTDEYPLRTDPTPQRPFILKIHGDIMDPSDSIVITDEDYIQFVMRMRDAVPYHPIPNVFLYRFNQWPTLFIGYSLMDYNLRLLFKTMRANLDQNNPPRTYSVDRSPDQLIFDVWQNRRRYVNFIAQDVWAFVPDLYRRVKGEEMPP